MAPASAAGRRAAVGRPRAAAASPLAIAKKEGRLAVVNPTAAVKDAARKGSSAHSPRGAPLPEWSSAPVALIAKETIKEKKERKRKERRRREASEKKTAAKAASPKPTAGQPAKATEARAAPAHRVFVGHLPQSCTEASIRDFFTRCGAVKEVDMLIRKTTGRFKGSAFVAFGTSSAAKLALKLDSTAFEGKQVVVQAAQPSESRQQESKEASKPAIARQSAAPAAAAAATRASSSIFVGNLPASVDARALRRVFRDCGAVQRVRLLPQVNGVAPGFIDFRNVGAAEAAVAMSGGCSLHGRTLTVQFSKRGAAPLSCRRSQEARKRRRAKRDETRDPLRLSS